MNVLVTAIGSFSADIVIKSLKRLGYKVIGCDIYPKEWIADAYNVNEFYQAPYVSDKEKYSEFIKKVCLENKIKYIFPLTDIEVDFFNNNRKWFEENNIYLCISSKSTLDICRNKKTTEEFLLGKSEIQPIPSEHLSDNDKCPFGFPVVCKPYDGRSSQGLKFIYNIDEWQNFIQKVDKSKYIVQPMISGIIVTVDIIRCSETGKTVAVARKELLRTLNGAGTSVFVFKDEYLESQSKKIADILNICGCVNFEFILDDNGKYHFIECNPRFSGGVEFSCISGYDCVLNHISCFTGKDIDTFILKKNQYISRKYEEYITKIGD